MTDSLLQRFTETIMPQYAITAGHGLDIACGSGEGMVYLAERGWNMTGVDRMSESLQKARTLADIAGVKISTINMDLEADDDPFSHFAQHSFDLITVSRYLHRPLFPQIKALVKPNGIVLYQTFMLGCELTPIGRPRNPDFLLKPGELASHFTDAEMLLDEETTSNDGRPFARFIARL